MYAFITRFVFFISLITSSFAALGVTPMLAAGQYHSVALKSDGNVVTWGGNGSGQLGDGTTTNHSSPMAVPGLTDVVAVAAGRHHTVALKSDGTVWAWGNNYYGQLGDGTTTYRSSPQMVPGISGVMAIAAGMYHTVAVKSDGTVMAWGNNGQGQLGDGTTTNHSSPVVVPGLSGVVAAAAGRYHTIALKSDGTVLTWGYNIYGQLGDGTTTQRNSPQMVFALSSVVAVAAGDYHTVALKSDGTVTTWGENGNGQLGDGTFTDRLSPVTVSGLGGVVKVAAGWGHTAASRSDGTVLTWGNNSQGQLGNGTMTSSFNPVMVPGLSGVTSLAAGTYYTVALKLDGTMVAWGDNSYGQLGDGTTVGRLRPVGVLGFGGSMIPALSYAPGYGIAGISPATGFLSTSINYKVVYSHAANTGPSVISVCIDALPCNAMSVDSTATTTTLYDGSYTNGEQYIFTTTLAAGPHSYYFTSSDGTSSTNLPATGSLSGPAISDLSITTNSLNDGTVGMAYSQTLAATGGTTPYSWSSGGLPPGLSLDTSTGVISGMPTSSGTYGFSINVSDAVGSIYSTAFSLIVATNPAATVPDAPIIGATIAGDAKASVAFSPPANNGGDAVISYTVSCTPACTPVSGSTSPILVTGLTNNTAYTFTVTATNYVGTSPSSAMSNSVTPLPRPSAPTYLSVMPITLSRSNLFWNAPAQAANVAYYRIYRLDPYYCPPGTYCVLWAPSPVLIATISGSPPATSYSDIATQDVSDSSYRVAACNALGDCSASPFVPRGGTASDVTSPTVPTGLSATVASASQINLAWSASTDDYGVTAYKVYRNGVLIATVASGLSYSNTTGLAVGTTYSYTVAACDAAANCSAQSAPVTVTTPAGYVDLVMTSVSISGTGIGGSATSFGVGGNLTINNTVTNAGNVSSASSPVKFRLSPDNTITMSDMALTATRLVPALAPGQSSVVATSVTLSKTMAPGIYYVGACVDEANLQSESNEGNNCLAVSTPITFVRDVDLVMTAVSTTATSIPVGTSFVIANTEMNQGMTMMTATSNTIRFYLSADNIITATDSVLTGTRLVSGLVAGASSAGTTTVTVPKTTLPGTYFIGAMADATNLQPETNTSETGETNNTLTGNTITVIRDVDLVMTAVSTTATSAGAGNSFVVDASVKNQGTTSTTVSSFTVGYYLSVDNIITGSDKLIGTMTVNSLAPVGVSNGSTTVTVPATTPPGAYYIGACADIRNMQPESNEANNCLATPGIILIIQNVDLIMTAVSTTATSVGIGNGFTISNTEKNQGTTAMSAASNTVKFYLSTDSTISSTDLLLTGTRLVSGLAAGGSSSGTTTVTVPKTTIPGTYYIGAIADATNVQVESDENNNWLAGETIVVVRDVDLVMSAVSVAATNVARGATFTINNTETNQGTTWMSATSNTVKFYLSLDNVITTTDIALTGTRTVTALAAGASSNASTTVTVPLTAALGTYYVGAIADVTNLQPETNESNNTLASLATIVISTPVDTIAPTAPGSVSAIAGSTIMGSQVYLSWSPSYDNVGVRRYEIYRQGCPVGFACAAVFNPQLIQTLVGSPPVNSYIDTGVVANTNYDYFVTACDAANNCSAWSVAHVTTLP